MRFKDFFEVFENAPNFNYQGGKTSIREWVLQFMPRSGKTYIEVFAGRANMFFLANKILSFKNWHLNDLNTTPFLNSIKDVNTEDLPEKMTEKEFLKYKKNRTDPISLALEPQIAFLGHFRGGFAEKYKKPKWDKELYKQKLTIAKKQLENVKITNLNWFQLPLNKYTKQDFVYLDPPYLETDNRYYSDIDHVSFLNTIKSMKCRWLLSHTNHPLYINKLGHPLATKERNANLSLLGSNSRKLSECVWKGNYY